MIIFFTKTGLIQVIPFQYWAVLGHHDLVCKNGLEREVRIALQCNIQAEVRFFAKMLSIFV